MHSPPPKVVFLKNHLGGKEGGLEKYTWRLIDAFTAKHCQVTLLTSSPIAPSKNYETIFLKTQKFCSFQNILAFDNACQTYLKAHPSDIVFGLDRNSFQTHLRAGNGVHAAFLEARGNHENRFKKISFKINPLHQILLRLEKKAFENPLLKVLLTNSEMVRRQILNRYQVDPHKIHVVYNGVEWIEKQAEFDNWEASKALFLRTHHLPEEAYHFMFIGHDFKRKGLGPLLSALSRLKHENFFLSVVGSDKQEKEYIALAEHLGIAHKVRFFGSLSDTTAFYQCADCLVIPSFYDPFANVTLEALAMGVFVITSDCNGAHEIIQKDTGLILTDLSDEQQFAKTLQQALAYPKTPQRARMIRASVQNLDFSTQLPKIIDLCLD